MRYLYLILICASLVSCKKEKSSCPTYEEAVAQGRIEKKTSDIKINDSLSYTLDFVIDKEDEKNGFYCTGSLELQQDEFNKAVNFLKGYDFSKIAQLMVFFEGTNLCKGEVPAIKDVKAYMVYYTDAGNYLCTDYINLATGIKESYRVSEIWGSVVVYELFESGIKKQPSVIVIENKSLEVSKTKLIKKSEDILYKKVHPDKIFLW